MAAYLTIAEFKVQSEMDDEDIEAIRTKWPGWLEEQLRLYSGRIDARLSKRYPVPFPLPAPDAVQDWLQKIVTQRAYWRFGFRPFEAEEFIAQINMDATTAFAEVAEAANGETGLFDLPQTPTSGSASAVTKGGPLAYSEASPYEARDRARERRYQ